MKYKNVLTLLNTTRTSDTIGNVIDTLSATGEVLFERHSLGTKEYYNAVSVGLRPVAEVQIKRDEYHGEPKVELDGQIMDVLRAITKGRFDIVLVLGFKLNNNGDEITEN